MNEAYKDVRGLKMTLKTLEIAWVEACCLLYTDASFPMTQNPTEDAQFAPKENGC